MLIKFKVCIQTLLLIFRGKRLFTYREGLVRMSKESLDRIEQKISEVIKRQDGFITRLEKIENKIDEISRLDNLRVIAQKAEIKFDPSLISGMSIDMKFIDTIYELEVVNKADHIERVMQTSDHSFTAGERGGPSDPGPLMTLHYRTMLKRYLFAGKVFCEGKRVFDCCCGRGWGTYLLSSYAKHVYAVDYDETLISECQSYWPSDNISWSYNSVLDPNLFEEDKFDVITGMEIIEHFTKDDGILLFDNVQRLLKSGGVFIGTSYYPDNRHQADNHKTLERPDHHFLWTKQELMDELGKHFKNIQIVDSWMIIATRK